MCLHKIQKAYALEGWHHKLPDIEMVILGSSIVSATMRKMPQRGKEPACEEGYVSLYILWSFRG